MREGWDIKTLGDVCEIYQPTTLSTKDLDENGKYFVYGANGIIGKYSNYNHEDSEVILTCRGSTCGTINVSLPFSWINGNAMVVRPKGNTLLKEYLKYLLRGIDYSKVITGAAQPQITRVKLAPTIISFPKSITEQQRIVDILDQEFSKIYALKANAEKSLQAAKDLFQATLKKELEPKEGWETQTIGEICILKSGNSNANNSPSGSLPFVKVGDMNIAGNEVFITCSSRYVDYLSNKKGIFPVGSVIFPKRGGAILTNKKRLTAVETCCDLNIMGVFPKKDTITPDYLFAFFQGVDMASIYDGAAIPQINNGDIAPLRISFPDIQEQKQITASLDDLNNKCKNLQNNYQKTLNLCDDLKQVLLRKAFNGELA